MTHSKSHTRIGRMVLVGITTLFSTVALAQEPNNTDESTQADSEQVSAEKAPTPVNASTLVVESPVVAEVIPVLPLVVGVVPTVNDVAPALKSLPVIVVS